MSHDPPLVRRPELSTGTRGRVVGVEGAMRTNLRLLLAPVVLVAFLGGGCSDDKESVTAGGSSTVATTAESSATTTSAAPAAAIDVASLTESWGCGYGFRASNADQTQAVVIEWTSADFTTEGRPVPDPAVTLPDEDWKAEVQIGSDLFANWCNDVIEPGTPTPEVTETWTITEGTITFGGVGGTCGTSDVTATLTDAVATDEDGNEVPIDDVELHNDTWGCFAG